MMPSHLNTYTHTRACICSCAYCCYYQFHTHTHTHTLLSSCWLYLRHTPPTPHTDSNTQHTLLKNTSHQLQHLEPPHRIGSCQIPTTACPRNTTYKMRKVSCTTTTTTTTTTPTPGRPPRLTMCPVVLLCKAVFGKWHGHLPGVHHHTVVF